MRRFINFAILTGFALISTPAAATVFVYNAGLNGANESPVIVTPGTGTTTVTYNDALHTLRVQVTFSDLLGITTASHIHVRPDLATPNGGVATQTPTFAGFPLGVTSGVFDGTFDLTSTLSWNPAFITSSGGTAAGAEAALFNGLQSGRAYLNVHSAVSPSGEIRGNLSAVPEAATWAMMILGFSVIGGLARRRSPPAGDLILA